MPRQSVILVAFFIASSLLSCRGPEGPVGPPGPPGGDGNLTDPRIQPKVIFTFPPANTVGPYEYFSEYYNEIQFRFNKIMDRTSIHDAVTLSSPNTRVHFDTSLVGSLGDDLWYALPADSPRSYYNLRWRIGETYTLGISSTARDVNGNTLNPPFSMTFEPEPYFRVVSVYPRPGLSDVQLGNSIRIIFNNAVDTSTFSRIHITPAIPGRWNYGYGYYYYPDSASIYFTGLLFSANTTYTVRVDASVRDVDGRMLQQEFVSSFTTVPFRLWFTSPPDGRTGVSPIDEIFVDFTALIDTGSARSAFSISPNVPGILSPWYAGFTFNAIPQLACEKSYTVTVDTSLRSVDGAKLATPYQFTFTTAPFTVFRTDPSDGQVGAGRSYPIYVFFNAFVDSSTIRSSFTLKDSTGAVVGGTTGIPGNRFAFFLFNPVTPLAPNAWYTGKVSTSLKAMDGSALKSDYVFSFKTGT